jgi:hypothetical protein
MAFDFAQAERRLVRIPKDPFSLSEVEGHAGRSPILIQAKPQSREDFWFARRRGESGYRVGDGLSTALEHVFRSPPIPSPCSR